MSSKGIAIEWHHYTPFHDDERNQARLASFYEKADKFLQTLVEDDVKVPSFIQNMLSESARDDVARWAQNIQKNCSHLIVLGTGGSSRGGHAIYAHKNSSNRLDDHVEPIFLENIGSHSMDNIVNDPSPLNRHYLVISKSGTTAETLAQCLVCMNNFEDRGFSDKISEHFTFITGDRDSPLLKIAEKFGCKVFEHPQDLGGRYSVLSVVGMAPAIVAGMNVQKILQAAHTAFAEILNPNILVVEKQAVIGAATQAHLYKHEAINQTILMPYDSRLVPFSRWFQQLWAESLGKDGKGTSPSIALGPMDQHSQLQLYLQGPRDKYFTLITEDNPDRGPVVDKMVSAVCGAEYLAGRSIGELVSAEAAATIKTLENAGRPLRVISCSNIDESVMGHLFAHFMMETIIMAELIGVDPYTQPAVQRGKQLTKMYLEQCSD